MTNVSELEPSEQGKFILSGPPAAGQARGYNGDLRRRKDGPKRSTNSVFKPERHYYQ